MEIEQIPTKNHSSRQQHDIDGIILHFTAGGDIKGTLNWLSNPEAQASAHYVISRGGRIVQMVDESRAAWHAGSSTTTPKLNGRKNLNLWTIGIEICNWGWIYEAPANLPVTVNSKTYERKMGEFYTRLRKWTYPYKGPRPKNVTVNSDVLTKGKNPFPGGNVCYWWEPYTAAQIEAVKSLVKDILSRHNHITKEYIARHQDVDPTRKLDTGPALNLEGLLEYWYPPQIEAVPDIQVGWMESSTVSVEEIKEIYEPRTDRKKWCFS